MKHLKYFEHTIDTPKSPKIGDYAIINPYTHPDEVNNWILNHIGQIIDIEDVSDNDMYVVKYEDIPKGWEGHFTYAIKRVEQNRGFFPIKSNIRKTAKFGIEHFSPNKKDVEQYIQAKKYNL